MAGRCGYNAGELDGPLEQQGFLMQDDYNASDKNDCDLKKSREERWFGIELEELESDHDA